MPAKTSRRSATSLHRRSQNSEDARGPSKKSHSLEATAPRFFTYPRGVGGFVRRVERLLQNLEPAVVEGLTRRSLAKHQTLPQALLL